LENEKILDSFKISQNSIETKLPEGIQPIVIPEFPICEYNYALYFFPDTSVPQILSNDILIIAVQIFSFTKNPTLKLAWNSMKACNKYNHMHF